MGSTPSLPTPTASPPAGPPTAPATGLPGTPSVLPSPEANFPPIPPLPDLPSDAYQRLLHLSNTIDATVGSFNAASGQLNTIQGTTNTAVGGIFTNSQGATTNALNEIWYYSGKDFTNASTPLTSITAPNALGGSPNQLQAALLQHQADFLNGIPAVEQLRNLVATNFASGPSVDAVQELLGLALGVEKALGNVNMALWLMISAIFTINSGISYTCATGLVPGQFVPTFTPNAFAMEGNGGSGSSNMTADQFQRYLEEQGVDPETAGEVALYAEEQGLSLSDIQKMFDTLIQGGSNPEETAEQIRELIGNESLSKWYEAQPGRNLSDATVLLNKGFSTEAVTTLLNQGADLQLTLSRVKYLLGDNVPISALNEWMQHGLNLVFASELLGTGVSVNEITSQISTFTDPDPGNLWQAFVSNNPDLENEITPYIQHWTDGGSFAHNTSPFQATRRGQTIISKQLLPSNTGPYQQFYLSGNSSLYINRYCQAVVVLQEHPNYPAVIIPVPYSYIQKVIGQTNYTELNGGI